MWVNLKRKNISILYTIFLSIWCDTDQRWKWDDVTQEQPGTEKQGETRGLWEPRKAQSSESQFKADAK